MSLTQERIPSTVVPAPRSQGCDTASWRAVLESRWRDRLQELTRLCVAFHETEALDGAAQPTLRRLMRQTVRTRQALAETDDALRRVADGAFGYCEDCGAQIPAARLRGAPEERYCDRCAAG